MRWTNSATKTCPEDVVEAIRVLVDFIGDDELRHREDHRCVCHVFESIARIERWLLDKERRESIAVAPVPRH